MSSASLSRTVRARAPPCLPDVTISDFYSQRVVTIEPHPALLRLHLVEPADFLRSQLRHLVVAPSLGSLTGRPGGRQHGANKREAAWSWKVIRESVRYFVSNCLHSHLWTPLPWGLRAGCLVPWAPWGACWPPGLGTVPCWRGHVELGEVGPLHTDISGSLGAGAPG